MSINAGTKLAYGIGQAAETVKRTGFDIFVFFYFTQVLGLSGSLAGAAVTVALIFDAVSDPVAGRISDAWSSDLGRRHPFIYAAIIPLSITWILLFMPPDGLSQMALFAWLTVFSILVRACITVYYVPYLALGAELTQDYHERTSIAAWRGICGVLGAVVVVLAIPLFFPESDAFENGLLNPSGYPKVAVAGAIIMAVTIFLSARFTQNKVPKLRVETSRQGGSSRLLQDIIDLWSNPSFVALFVGAVLVAVGMGIVQTLNMHLGVFFWKLSTSDIALLSGGLLFGLPVGILLSHPLHKRFDKKWSIVFSAVVTAVTGNIAVILRLMDCLPDTDSVYFIPIALMLLFVNGMAAGVAITTGASMMADITHEHYLRTGRQQEGFLFSAIAFSNKMSAAAGYFVAGVGLDMIGFPAQALPSEVTDEQVSRLALLSLSAGVFGLLAACMLTFYRSGPRSGPRPVLSISESKQFSPG